MRVLENELVLVRRAERRILQKKSLFSGLDKLREKVPEGLEKTLNRAFRVALRYFMEDGGKLIDKLIPADEILAEYREKEAAILREMTYESIRQLDKSAARSRSSNLAITAIEGTGLGLLGVGLPDVPVFLGMILKTARETALRYGFEARTLWEESYFLKVICAGIAGGEEGKALFAEADRLAAGLDFRSDDPITEDLDMMIDRTADALSAMLLTAKFVQGTAVVGALGGAFNMMVLGRVEESCAAAYKKRRLLELDARRR